MTDEPPGSRSGRRPRPSDALAPDPDPDDIAAALLGRPRSLGRRDVSAGAEVSLLSARKLWHALGFPVVTNDDPVFTEADVYALRSVARMVREGDMDETTVLAHTRAFARTADRLAAWQVQLVAESIAGDDEDLDPADAALGTGPLAVPDVATAKAVAVRLVDLVDELEPLLVYAWRRHLTDAISRMIQDAEPSVDEHGMWRHIGFADLVSFTSVVRRLSERQLAELVKRFEILTSDIVTAHGGRIIKTVGDEILFSNREAAPAAATALDLVDAMTGDEVLPEVRVGMAAGPVLSRLGDIFGTTVNRASRLTAIAHPSAVVVDSRMAAELDSVSGFALRPLRRRALRGVGEVKPYVLLRSSVETRTLGPEAGGGAPGGATSPSPPSVP
ncbi:adenylate/guanylate cyclase domain-containing protein [Lapillicoccus jejuensis]|uniref:Adenylate cyclase n=1 Tax=Lapillicoccus jejuensis TaxID=402171 RepID=A0A542E2B7_9MICO|nr:adenylate/guanylate cyclase domain-containing protein [Lapillicoccus jejuensis]TQJ09476.1 adenylate cyclase [Lapillicoccus jejuensis]